MLNDRLKKSSPLVTVSRSVVLLAVVVALGAVLGACGGGGGGGSSSDTGSASNGMAQISGVAAVGAPIVGASVTAKCADGSGFTITVSTTVTGEYTGEVDESSLPCALKVSGGSPAVVLHSMTYSAGITNITPLTDLAIAYASSELPEDWFSGDISDLNDAALDAAMAALLDQFSSAGFSLPSEAYDAFNQAFSIGDSADQFLDAIDAAIAADPDLDNYTALLTLIKDGTIEAIDFAPVAAESGNEIRYSLDGVNYVFPLHEGFSPLGLSLTVIEEEAGPDGIWTQVYLYLNDYTGPDTYALDGDNRSFIIDNQEPLVRCMFTGAGDASGQFVITESDGVLHGEFEATLECANAFYFDDATEHYGNKTVSGSFDYRESDSTPGGPIITTETLLPAPNDSTAGTWQRCDELDSGSELYETVIQKDGSWVDTIYGFTDKNCTVPDGTEPEVVSTGTQLFGDKVTLADGSTAYESDWYLEMTDEMCYNLTAVQGDYMYWGLYEVEYDCTTVDKRSRQLDLERYLIKQ